MFEWSYCECFTDLVKIHIIKFATNGSAGDTQENVHAFNVINKSAVEYRNDIEP